MFEKCRIHKHGNNVNQSDNNLAELSSSEESNRSLENPRRPSQIIISLFVIIIVRN